MKPTEFVKVNTQFWGDHLRSVSEHLPTSHRAELPGQLLYPRMMVLTETPDWNILELVGVSREYRSLEVRRQKANSIEEYFGIADGSPVVTLPGENLFKDATVATEVGRHELDARFPSARKMLGTEYVGAGDQLLRFAPGNYSTFERVLLVHSAGQSIRVHWTFIALAIHRSEPADKYLNFLQNHLNAANRMSVIVRNPGGSYQPGMFDSFVERADGSHIVGDLKLPLLDTADGKKRRRAFTTPVRDGAAQLARYEEYFRTPENRSFAQTKYGVDVTDPRKLLVIGTQQTVGAQEFKDASPAAVEIIDYDTILRLHLAAKS